MKNHVRDAYASYAMTVIALFSLSVTGAAAGPAASMFIIASVIAPWAAKPKGKHRGRGAKWHASWRKNSDAIYLASIVMCGVSFIVTAHRMSTATQATELAILALMSIAVELVHHRIRKTLPRNTDRFQRGHGGAIHPHR